MNYRALTLCAALALAGSALAAKPAGGEPKTAQVRPLTYEKVVSYFKKAGLRPTEVQKRCTVLFEGEYKSAAIYDYCLIIVENSDRDLQVTFFLTDADEMNWITEFVDSLFFTHDETKRLFGLINSKRDVRDAKIGRFRVDYHRWEPRHALIFVFSFTPLRT